ncbi:hypothetical protein PM082_023378 [Marasmius tenuissimus]|nr:hypothetical protein PM082_023378 [Marasmius tenuissimus]
MAFVLIDNAASTKPPTNAEKVKKLKVNDARISIDSAQLAELTNFPMDELEDMNMDDVDKRIKWLLTIKRRGQKKKSMATLTTSRNTSAFSNGPNREKPKKQPARSAATITTGIATGKQTTVTANSQPAIPVLSSPSANCQVVEKIARPKGTPGQKSGFNVQMSARVFSRAEWNRFKRVVHQAALSCGINFRDTYLKQDRKIRRHVCLKVEEQLPYFCKERFPNWWPIECQLQQFIKNRRKNDTNPRPPKQPKVSTTSLFKKQLVWESDGEGNYTLVDDVIDSDAESGDDDSDEEEYELVDEQEQEGAGEF